MLADHLPHELAVDWYYAELLLIAAAAIVAVVALFSGRHRPIRHRLLLGVGIALATILPTMTWGYCAERVPLGLLALLLASPALVALSHHVVPRRLADISFAVASCAVLGLFVVGQSLGCWRFDSYIGTNANVYAVAVAIPMVASWLCAWAWSNPTRARAIRKKLAFQPSKAPTPHPGLEAITAVGDTHPAPSPTQMQRAHWLARMAILPMAAGVILIPTVLLAPPGVVVLASAWVVRRGSRPVRAGLSQWSLRSVIGLVTSALLTSGGGSLLLIWAIQEEFNFSSAWSPALLWGALAWSVVYVVLIVRSLIDRGTSSVAREHGRAPEVTKR